MSARRSKATASISTTSMPPSARCRLARIAPRAASRSAGWCRANASRMAPTEKQNIPEFHRELPLSRYPRATSSEGFSTKRRTCIPGPPPIASPISMYPKPTSGRVGAMPKVTGRHAVARERAGHLDVAPERGLVLDEVVGREHEQHRVRAVFGFRMERRHGERRRGVAPEGLEQDRAFHAAGAVLVRRAVEVIAIGDSDDLGGAGMKLPRALERHPEQAFAGAHPTFMNGFGAFFTRHRPTSASRCRRKGPRGSAKSETPRIILRGPQARPGYYRGIHFAFPPRHLGLQEPEPVETSRGAGVAAPGRGLSPHAIYLTRHR